MRALCILEPGRTAIVDRPDPEPAPGEVLLRVRKVGFCGSDLSTFLGRNPLVSYPRIPGHEIAAEVERVAEGVPAAIRPGQAVTVVPYTSCGTCTSCRRGRPNACRHNRTLGVQRDGAMAERLAVPWGKIVAAPGLGLTELALVEPLTVGFHAVDRAAVEAADTVAVLGCGMIGLGAVAGAARRGATVVAVDVDDAKLATARAAGARHAVNSKASSLHGEIERITEGRGADVVIEAAGLPATYRAAVDEVAFAGRVACIGYAKDEVAFATKLFVQKEIDLRGSRNATPKDFADAADLLAKGAFPAGAVVTREAPLEGAGEALAAWAKDPAAVTKIVVSL